MCAFVFDSFQNIKRNELNGNKNGESSTATKKKGGAERDAQVQIEKETRLCEQQFQDLGTEFKDKIFKTRSASCETEYNTSTSGSRSNSAIWTMGTSLHMNMDFFRMHSQLTKLKEIMMI